jgi:transcriptional regulator with XRE-family HTH domain
MLDIKAEREKRGMTQDEFADLLGVSRKTIVNYESGGNIPDTKEKIFSRILSNNTHVSEPDTDYGIDIKELAYLVIQNEDELMKIKAFSNLIELRVAKRVMEVSKSKEALEKFLNS